MKFTGYPAYQDSNVPSIGLVPRSWTMQRLKQVVDENRQITYGIVQAGPNVDDGIPYVRPADMSDEAGIGDLTALLRTSPQIAANYRRSSVQRGDLICSIGPSFGKVMIVPPELEGGNLTQGTARVAVSGKNSARFIFWVLRSAGAFQQWESSVGGATFRALNLGPLSETELARPPLDEQTRIAKFLDYETAKIDQLIDKQQQLIALLKEKRQAVISHAVTKGLNPDAPMKDSGVEWLGQVPAHWNVSRLKHAARSGTSITYGIVQAGPHVENGVPYIKTSDMAGDALPSEGYSKTSLAIDASYARSRVVPGDIVISIRASVGKCLPVPSTLKLANLTQGTAKISPGRDVDGDFLLAYLSSSPIQDYLSSKAKGATFKEITLDMLRRVPVLLPPPKEQLEIAREVEAAVRQYAGLCRAAARQTELLAERRAALISAAVTGKIDVRNWQPPESEATQEVA